MCTVFAGGDLVAKNYDSISDYGMVFTNKKGLLKKALIMDFDHPMEWVSIYGNITFSQSGKEFPVSGMNEKGLVVEQTTLPETIYEKTDGKPLAGCLETIQYLLDTCSTVKDALKGLDRLNIVKTSWPIHFFLHDKIGDVAIVEYLQGQKLVYKDHNVSINVLTNSSYLDSIDYLSIDTSKCNLDDYQMNSIARFKTVTEFLNSNNEQTRDCFFEVLNKVKRHDTIWSNVYDLDNMNVSLFSKYHSKMFNIDLNTIDFSPHAKDLALDIRNDSKEFVLYDDELNLNLIISFFTNEHIKKIMNLQEPQCMIDMTANHYKNIKMENDIVIRFLEKEQVKQIPVKWTHKLLVLKYLVSKFEFEREYTEAEVNAIISKWHTFGDYFILRRELVDNQLLKRLPNGSKYWRDYK